MIHVTKQPEPSDFDKKVRRPGSHWMRNENIDLHSPLPKGKKLPPYWHQCLDNLYSSYTGCCAYLGVWFSRTTAYGTVDHFKPKSKRPDLAYEWDNYRLSCSRMNSRKGENEDILDPFLVQDGWFWLELFSGSIYPNPHLDQSIQDDIQRTIDRLTLDDAQCRDERCRLFDDYLSGDISKDWLKKHAPFIYAEAQRQNML